MARRPSKRLDTTEDIREALADVTLEDSESDREDHSDISLDTDSLSDDYVPSADEMMSYAEERREDDELYASLSQTSVPDESEREMLSAFGTVKKVTKRTDKVRCQKQPTVLPSPATAPIPVQTSTPMLTTQPVDEGEEGDVEDLGNRAGKCL